MGHSTETEASPGVLAACGVAVLVAGLLSAGMGVRAWLTYSASADWARLPARIVSAELREDHTVDSDTTYTLDCTYDYEVQGQPHRGTRVAPFGDSSSQRAPLAAWHRDLEAHRTSGKPWLAFVDPGDPSRSLLVRNFSTMILLTIPAGLLLGLMGLRLLAKARAARQARSTPQA